MSHEHDARSHDEQGRSSRLTLGRHPQKSFEFRWRSLPACAIEFRAHSLALYFRGVLTKRPILG